jgi:hypothetical protein
MKILEVRFKWSGTREEYEIKAIPGANKRKDVAGLLWKIYGFDDEKSIATGIYLFKDEEALNKYLVPFKKATQPEGVSDMEFQIWDLQYKLSKITNAPI